MNGRILVVAGSDSGGGAGIQADIKTLTALGAYAATAITALTVQNTTGVHGIHEVPTGIIVAQMRAVLDDIGTDVVKTGMLHRADIVEAVAAELAGRPPIPLVVDPVLVAKGGSRLLDADALGALKAILIPLTSVLTPNAPEAEALTGLPVENLDDMRRAAEALLTLGAGAVLVKGGHVAGEPIRDLLAWPDGEEIFSSPRIHTRHTHGTGCTLASAIAAGLAQGLDVHTATARARDYVQEAIRTAPGYGSGHGPLNHAHPCAPGLNEG